MKTKSCSKCKKVLPATIEYFTKNRQLKNGFRSWCRQCTKKYNQRPEVKERKNKWAKEYYKKPGVKEKRREYGQRFEVKKKHNARSRERYQQPEVKERKREYNKKYISRPEVKERLRNYRQERRKNPVIRKRLAQLHQLYKERALKLLTNEDKLVCAKTKQWLCCNPRSPYYKSTLSIDHINSDGKQDRKRFNSRSFYKWIVEHPVEARKKLQLLCMNAQFIKRQIMGELDAGKRNKSS